ncbi:MAG: alpha/beta hydrolase [Sphingomonas bacterium]|nr:alpha/beta hydrolase [Sphingomonas bacterium]
MASISRGIAGTVAFSAIMAVAGGHAFAQRARLSPECREPIRAQCAYGGDRRACIIRVMQTLSDACRKQISAAAASRAPRAQGLSEFAYGTDPAQQLDVKRAATSAPAPLLVFIHGGGWSIGDKTQAVGAKADHFTARGFAFASLNYRLVPQATVEQQAADIAAAIAWLRAHAADHGINPDRIIVMGHSAGAHLAALVASDPSFLLAAGVPFTALKGAVLLDGAGYDVPTQMVSPKNLVGGMYSAAFGTNPARQKALSPLYHAAAPNAAAWLILPVAARSDSTAKSQALAAALNRNGTRATVTPVPDSSHSQLNHKLGTVGDFATAQVDAFLAAI